jgi:hypothetical protein
LSDKDDAKWAFVFTWIMFCTFILIPIIIGGTYTIIFFCTRPRADEIVEVAKSLDVDLHEVRPSVQSALIHNVGRRSVSELYFWDYGKDEEEAKVKDLAGRGISVRHLLELCECLHKYNVMPCFDPEKTTSNEVTRKVILPMCRVTSRTFTVFIQHVELDERPHICSAPVQCSCHVRGRDSDQVASDSVIMLAKEALRNAAKQLCGYMHKYPTSGKGGWLRGKRRWFAIEYNPVPPRGKRDPYFELGYWKSPEEQKQKDAKHVIDMDTITKIAATDDNASKFAIMHTEQGNEKELKVFCKDRFGFDSPKEAKKWITGLSEFIAELK